MYSLHACMPRWLLWGNKPHFVNTTHPSNCISVFLWGLVCECVWVCARWHRKYLQNHNRWEDLVPKYKCKPKKIFLKAWNLFYWSNYSQRSTADPVSYGHFALIYSLFFFSFQPPSSDRHPGGELWPDNGCGASRGGWSVQSLQCNTGYANEQSPWIHRDSPGSEGQEEDR